MLPILELCDKMASITRWSHATCLRPESVLEHTGFVAIYAYQIGLKHGADMGRLLQKAIVHDMEEVITGDIPTPTKYYSADMQRLIGDLELRSANAISEEVFGGAMVHTWIDAKKVGDLEGQIVYLADLAAVAYKIWAEKELGSRKFMVYRIGIFRRLDEALEILPEKLHSDITDLIDMLEELK